jgi:hypothetical protein
MAASFTTVAERKKRPSLPTILLFTALVIGNSQCADGGSG